MLPSWAFLVICSSGLAGIVDTTVLTSPTLERLMPSIGNGYVATHPIVGTGGGVHAAYVGNSIYMAGVYNGVSKNRSAWGTDRRQSHRASIPDWVTAISSTCPGGGVELRGYSLDMRRAVVTKAWSACDAALRVEEHHFAHQTRRNLLVHLVNATIHGRTGLTLRAEQFAGPACGEASPSRGDGCDVHLQPAACGRARRCLNGSIVESELPPCR